MEYAIWKPEHDGHAPPNWREGMVGNADAPYWWVGRSYLVPAEALNSPNDDAETPDAVETGKLENIVRGLRQYPTEELAKHGITLAAEKDWATELWADLRNCIGDRGLATEIKRGHARNADKDAIELLRTRFEQMIAERSTTNDR